MKNDLDTFQWLERRIDNRLSLVSDHLRVASLFIEHDAHPKHDEPVLLCNPILPIVPHADALVHPGRS